jgi:hypothetical protein
MDVKIMNNFHSISDAIIHVVVERAHILRYVNLFSGSIIIILFFEILIL